MTYLTIFSAPKPFSNPHIATIQRNAIRSWRELGADVDVILVGEEQGLAEAARGLGVRHITQVARNEHGTPLVSSIFAAARDNSTAPLLAYVNADILLLPNFLSTARRMTELAEKFLLVGQRWNLDVQADLDFSDGWVERLKQLIQTQGKIHPPAGSDYFIFPRQCYVDVPDFAIGRAGWDNWMIYESRRQEWKTIDATGEIQVIHQSHDYSHLPDGKAHYRLPETDENIRLAGGKRAIFTLTDANWVYVNGAIKRVQLNGKQFIREIEIFPLIFFKSIFLGELSFLIFHPKKAYGTIRAWFDKKNRKQE